MTTQSPRIATEADLARIAQFNRTEMPFPDNVTLQALIEAQITKHPDDTAVICGHDQVFGASLLTYAQLNDRANQLAHLLRAEGVRPGDLVALMVERSFGIIKAGGAYLPVSPDTPPERIAYMLKDGGVKILLTRQDTARRVVFEGLTMNLDDPDVYRGSTANPAILTKPQDLAYVIYTSGSTGKP